MPASTAQDIISKSLQKLVILGQGEIASAAMLADGLYSLNAMLDSWAGRSLLTTAQVQDNVTLTALKGMYTIGLTGSPTPDIVSAKPFSVESAYILDSNYLKYDLFIVGRETYNAYYDSNVTGEVTRPQSLFYDPGITQETNQIGTINLYPYPDNAGPYVLYIFSEKSFTEFSNLTDSVTFPPVYLRAMIYNLACELAPDYGKKIHPEIFEIAHESMRIIENINSRNKRVLANMSFSGKQKSFNILSGMNE
jgi:hypothetical protein